jgi:glycosyltransferase involved in cell wall biosynthesis
LKKNKILHIITSLDSGGTEGVLSRLVLFDREYVDHVVISLKNKGRYGGILEENNITVYSLNFQKKYGSFFEFIKLVKIVAKEKPTLIQTWLYHADFIGTLVAKFLRIKNLAWGIRTSKITVEISNPLLLKLIWILARISRLSQINIASCSVTAMNAHIQIGYDEKKFTIIPNGFDSKEFCFKPKARGELRAKWGLEQSDVLLGCIARWNPFKDHDNLFQALTLLKNNKSVHCVLMGDSIDPQNNPLLKLITHYNLSKQIIFASNQLNVAEVMSALDLFVLPSLSEGFPNVLGEAMLCEVPVVSTDVGDSRLIVDSCGWLVPPSNPLLLSKAMDTAISLVGSSQYEELKLKSRNRIVVKFPLEKMVNDFHEFWDSIINIERK